MLVLNVVKSQRCSIWEIAQKLHSYFRITLDLEEIQDVLTQLVKEGWIKRSTLNREEVFILTPAGHEPLEVLKGDHKDLELALTSRPS